MLFLDGVYVRDDSGKFVFHCNKAPGVEQLNEVLHTISQRVARSLERQGLLERDEDNSYLTLDGLDEGECLPFRCFRCRQSGGLKEPPWASILR